MSLPPRPPTVPALAVAFPTPSALARDPSYTESVNKGPFLSPWRTTRGGRPVADDPCREARVGRHCRRPPPAPHRDGMPTNTLYRLAGWAGLAAGVLLLIATARRGGLLPDNALTHAIAPPASALALFALTALYLRQRDRAGTLGLVGFAVNLVGLAGLFAVEFTTHAVFPYLDETTRTGLLAGPTR